MPISCVNYLKVPGRNGKTERLIRPIKTVDDWSRATGADRVPAVPLLKDFAKSRLQFPALVLDVVEIDRDEADFLERRLAGRRRHVDTRRVDATVDDDLLGLRRDHELGKRLSGVEILGTLEHAGR